MCIRDRAEATVAPEAEATAQPAEAVQPADAAQPAEAAKPAEPIPTPMQDDADDSDDDTGPQKKRKRTRKRKNPYAEPKLGPAPESVEGTSEAAQRAIAYAQAYLKDKESWKFSKPRQNWLVRHILWSQPIHEAASELSALPEATRNALPQDVQTTLVAALQLPEGGAWVPDEHVSVVSVYLQSIMGLAKQVCRPAHSAHARLSY